jgi:ferredoxin
VDAIYAEDDVPTDQQHFTALNAELSKAWKPIIEKKDSPPDADDWAKVTGKLDKLER